MKPKRVDTCNDEALLAVGMAYAGLLSSPLMVPLFRMVIAEAPRFPELGEELYQRGKEPYLVRLHAYFEWHPQTPQLFDLAEPPPYELIDPIAPDALRAVMRTMLSALPAVRGRSAGSRCLFQLQQRQVHV